MAEDGKSPNSEAPSVEDLARRLMDLWQEQMAAIAADPDLMRQMARMMAASPFPAMMQGIVQGMLAAGRSAAETGQNPYEWWKADHGISPQKPAPAQPTQTGPAPAAPAPEPGGGDLAELRRHLAGLEARLAELGAAGRNIVSATDSAQPKSEQPKPKPKRAARKPAAPVAGPAGGSGPGGTGGADDGAAG